MWTACSSLFHVKKNKQKIFSLWDLAPNCWYHFVIFLLFWVKLLESSLILLNLDIFHLLLMPLNSGFQLHHDMDTTPKFTLISTWTHFTPCLIEVTTDFGTSKHSTPKYHTPMDSLTPRALAIQTPSDQTQEVKSFRWRRIMFFWSYLYSSNPSFFILSCPHPSLSLFFYFQGFPLLLSLLSKPHLLFIVSHISYIITPKTIFPVPAFSLSFLMYYYSELTWPMGHPQDLQTQLVLNRTHLTLSSQFCVYFLVIGLIINPVIQIMEGSVNLVSSLSLRSNQWLKFAQYKQVLFKLPIDDYQEP